VFLLCVLLLGPALTYAPQDSAPQVQIQNLSLAAADEVEFMGVWPYGPCQAAAIDPARNIALVGNGETLQVLDISNPSSLSMIGEARLEGNPQGIVVAGNYAYVVTISYFIVIDLADPKIPREVASVFLSIGDMRSLALSANHVYLASIGGLLIYDVSNPRQPVYRAHYDQDKLNVTDVAPWGNYALCLGEYYKLPGDQQTTYGVEVIDVSLPSAPSLTGRLDLGKDYMPQDIDVPPRLCVCLSIHREE
jgi:hypothetical protein